MNVASLELCKELYELSGKTWVMPSMPVYAWTDDNDNFVCPKYNLGYLLRKLPRSIANGGTSFLDLEADLFIGLGGGITWQAGYRVGAAQAQILGVADTPEDAVCKLAIELIKQKVIIP